MAKTHSKVRPNARAADSTKQGKSGSRSAQAPITIPVTVADAVGDIRSELEDVGDACEAAQCTCPESHPAYGTLSIIRGRITALVGQLEGIEAIRTCTRQQS